MENVILTPIYNGTVYKYHECSNCTGKIYFEEDFFIPFHFKENIKYCPFCGKEIIRYEKPRYEELPNWEWLEEFQRIIEKNYRELEYIIHCKKSGEEIKDLGDKIDFGIEYFKGNNYHPISNGNVCKLLKHVVSENLHYSTKTKLKNEFERSENKQ